MASAEHDIDLADAASVGRLVARARRLADLSQRDLAARIGVSSGAIARLEAGTGHPSLPLLAAILTAARLPLRIVGDDDTVVGPFPATAVRDNGGRRFPAHLDVAPPDEVPFWATRGPRYDRAAPRGWYQQRQERDRLFSLKSSGSRPVDHPTQEQLAERERLRRGPQPVVRPAPAAEIVCVCPDVCFDDDEVIGCLPGCPCQCEPSLS